MRYKLYVKLEGWKRYKYEECWYCLKDVDARIDRLMMAFREYRAGSVQCQVRVGRTVLYTRLK